MKRLAILAALACAAPLRAQQPPAAPALDCPLEGIADGQRALAGAAASQRLTDVPADGEQRGAAALEAILAAVPRCAQAGGWTEAQRELASQYVLIRLAREEMVRRYAAQNVDLSFIDSAVASPRRDGTPPFADLVARLRTQGVGDDRPDSASDIVYLYLEMAGQMAAIRWRFTHPSWGR